MERQAAKLTRSHGRLDGGNGSLPRFPPLLSRVEWDALGEQYGLTPRELQIIDLLCRGLGYKQLCAGLNITRPTLRTHLRSAYDKLGCSRAIEVVLLLAHGSAPGGPPGRQKGAPAEADRGPRRTPATKVEPPHPLG